MAGLGLRYCQNHPSEPLMLVSKGRGTYWRCEHESGCAYTENAIKTGNKVTAINGRNVPKAARNSHYRPLQGSTVEKAATDNEQARAARLEGAADPMKKPAASL